MTADTQRNNTKAKIANELTSRHTRTVLGGHCVNSPKAGSLKVEQLFNFKWQYARFFCYHPDCPLNNDRGKTVFKIYQIKLFLKNEAYNNQRFINYSQKTNTLTI